MSNFRSSGRAGKRRAIFLFRSGPPFTKMLIGTARFSEMPNMALNLAPFGRWTLRDKAAPRRLALR